MRQSDGFAQETVAHIVHAAVELLALLRIVHDVGHQVNFIEALLGAHDLDQPVGVGNG